MGVKGSLTILLIFLSGLLLAEEVAGITPGLAAAPVEDSALIGVDAIVIPRMLSYQGRLTDSLGNPVPDGSYQLTFRLYSQESGGTPFWTEVQTVNVRNGIFSVLLGSVTSISSIPDAGTVYLSLQVGTGSELTPRLRIVSSAYAFLTERAANADLLQGRDTTYFARANHTHSYVDSAGGAQRVGGLSLAGLDGRYVNEGQANSVTSGMITDGTIVRADVASGFKAPYADTADYARVAPAVDSARVAGNSHRLQGKDTLALSAKFVDEGQANSVTSGMITDGQVGNADLADNAVNSAKIQDGTITNSDISATAGISDSKLAGTGTVVTNLNADLLDGNHASAFLTIANDYGRSGVATDLYEGTLTLSAKYVNEGQTAGGDLTGTYPNPTIANNVVTSAKIQDGTIISADIANGTILGANLHQMGATTGQVLKWTGSTWAPRNDSIGAGDNAWVRGAPDSVLYTIRQLGIARGGAYNMLYGINRHTHTNLGYACTTGVNGGSHAGCAVGGGFYNNSTNDYTTVAGGVQNTASGARSMVGGGSGNRATGDFAAVLGGSSNAAVGNHSSIGGGFCNAASGDFATVAGGARDTVFGVYGSALSGYDNLGGDGNADTAATVAGGFRNSATAKFTFVGGGYINTASNNYATVGGGYTNTASGNYSTVAGGVNNTASAQDATVGGGEYNRATDMFTTVSGGWSNHASNTGAAIGGGGFNTTSGNYSTVGGGMENTASGSMSTVGGGYRNVASGGYAVVGGGWADTVKGYLGGVLSGFSNLAGDAAEDTGATVTGGYENAVTAKYAFIGSGRLNYASGIYSTVAGGIRDSAIGDYSFVGGGVNNVSRGDYSTVCGGYINIADGSDAFIGGGDFNTASGGLSVVAGGWRNNASGNNSTICGGQYNLASEPYATVCGGYADSSVGYFSFTANNHSVVFYTNSAAFNGQSATASNQLRCGTLSKAGGSFTIDHPLDPYGKILNHYFIEGPEMRNLYDGEVVLDASGRATVHLPEYFSALNRRPRIQLTGVGTSNVYVAVDIRGNTFVIGGKPGTKVYWQVTGERQDVSAEVIRRLMPVEQKKAGELAGRMLDDEFLSGCMEQLEREGKAQGIDFRTAAGRQRYEQMKNPPQLERKIMEER